MSEWCTVLLRNLSTVLHSSRSGTLLHLLPCPQMLHVFMSSCQEEQAVLFLCNYFLWPYVWFSDLWLRLFKSIKLLKLQTDLWNDALSTRDIISLEVIIPWLWCVCFHDCRITFASTCTFPKPSFKECTWTQQATTHAHWGRFLTSLWLFMFKMPFWGLNHTGHANGFLYLLLLLVAFAFCMALFMYDSGALLVVGYFVKSVTVHQVTDLRPGCF